MLTVRPMQPFIAIVRSAYGHDGVKDGRPHPTQNGSYSVTARLTGAAFFLSDGQTGRKNGRESQEETPDAASYRLGDNARDH